MKKAFITSLEEKVNPRHSAILVVDVQNIFCHKKSAVAKKGIDLSMPQKVIPNISSFIDRAREKSVKIIFIQQDINAFSDSQVSKEMMYRVGWKGIKHGKELKWSEELCIKPEAQGLVLRKKKYSAFFGTRLDSILKSKKIKTLIMTGVATNVCVDTTVRDGFMRNYYIVLPEDCVASYSKTLHKAALENMNTNFAYVTDSKELLRIWE